MKAYDQAKRMEVIRLYTNEGYTMSKISEELDISYNSVRNWIKRYKEKGEAGLIPNYSSDGRPTIYSKKIIEKAIIYKKTHPEWGAPFILIKLKDDFPDLERPKARWLQQIFKRNGLQPKKNKIPQPTNIWANKVFDCVQVDAKEKMKTADGQDCCYLNFVDEFSGSELDAFLFPLCTNLSSIS